MFVCRFSPLQTAAVAGWPATAWCIAYSQTAGTHYTSERILRVSLICLLHTHTHTHTRTIPAFTPQPQSITLTGTQLCLPTEGWPGWVDMGGWLYTEIGIMHLELNPGPVTHPSTNRARCRVTSYLAHLKWQTALGAFKDLNPTPEAIA